MKTRMRRVERMGLVLVAALALSALVGFGMLWAWSPGTMEPFLDADGNPVAGSVSEKLFLDVNGVRQGMFITGRSVSNPVLLYLHGGLPEYFLAPHYPTGLEDFFTIVWWEQRGSGISWSADIPQDTLTLDQMIQDTIAVTNYLRDRFGQEKIYLMGHSGGTFVGIHTAAREPQLYHAYVGVAQITSQLASEQLAYEYMLAQLREQGNQAMVRKLEAAPVTTGGIPDAYLRVRDVAMHQLGVGTTRTMRSVVRGIFLPSLTNRAYTLEEKLNMWRGKSQSGVSAMWEEILRADLGAAVPALELPAFFFHGAFDYTCSYPLAKEYFDGLAAPVKGFYSFAQSAHSPHFEEPERALRIMREDVLTANRALPRVRAPHPDQSGSR